MVNLQSVPVHTTSVLEIDLDIVKSNYAQLCKDFTGEAVGVVLKDDGYAMGAEIMARTVVQAGCRHFFVSDIREALQIQTILPKDVFIYTFNGVTSESETLHSDYGFVPVLISIPQIERWNRHAKKLGTTLPAVIHVDTGMSRTGLTMEDFVCLCENKSLLEGLDLHYMLSHLACSDAPGHPLNQKQLERVQEIRAHFPQIKFSFLNSDGVYLPQSYHCDLARVGLALYGWNMQNKKLQSAVSVYARILQVRTIRPGESVGYCATYTSDSDRKIATVCVGYADGWHVALSNVGHVGIAGHKAPIVGRVSMDLMGVDVTDIPVPVHDEMWVELVGSTISAYDLAKASKSITYEMMLTVGNHHHRIYKGLEKC